jgi:hypothetical protein
MLAVPLLNFVLLSTNSATKCEAMDDSEIAREPSVDFDQVGRLLI